MASRCCNRCKTLHLDCEFWSRRCERVCDRRCGGCKTTTTTKPVVTLTDFLTDFTTDFSTDCTSKPTTTVGLTTTNQLTTVGSSTDSTGLSVTTITGITILASLILVCTVLLLLELRKKFIAINTEQDLGSNTSESSVNIHQGVENESSRTSSEDRHAEPPGYDDLSIHEDLSE